MESILTSTKKLIGIEEDYEHFDPEIISHINTVLGDLTQLGVGPSEGFVIEDKTALWSDFIPNESPVRMEGVKSYMKLRVQLLFDPPSSASVLASNERQIERLEWRLNVAAESNGASGTGTSQNGDIELTDVTTGDKYNLYVDNGDLKMSQKGGVLGER